MIENESDKTGNMKIIDKAVYDGRKMRGVGVKNIEKKKSEIEVALAVCSVSAVIFISTEILSLFHGITMMRIRGIWLTFFSVFVFGVLFLKMKGKITFSVIEVLSWRKVLTSKFWIFIVAGVWLLFLCYLSYKTVPINFDSMTYHMARVANWIQNRSVGYYPTNIPRQLFSPVFAEYIVLHLCLLFGNDNAVNLVQYGAYILSLYFLWDILKKAGFSNRVAFLADVLFATMPMAIAQSITTQVDLVGCMWLLLFVDIIIKLITVEKLRVCFTHLRMIIACAVSIAFGYLTKSNVCFLMLPFLGWLLIRCIKRKDEVKVLCLYTFLAVVTILFFTFPTFARNYAYTGDILAAGYMSRIIVGTIRPRYLLVNIYKNFALLAASESTRGFITTFGLKFAGLLGVDIDAPEISVTEDFCENLRVSYHHDTANNPFIAWVFLIAIILWIVLIISKKKMMNKAFVGVCILAVVTGFTSLRYQVWGSRLLLSACAIMCMVSAMILEYFNVLILKNKLKNTINVCLSVMALIAAVPALRFNAQYAKAYNENGDRFKMYFGSEVLHEQYVDICDYVEALDVKKIGIFLGSDTYEYPLWVRLKKSDTEIIQVVAGNDTEVPECIIAINKDMPIGCEYAFENNVYTCVYNYEENAAFAVLLPSPVELKE